MYVIYVSLHLPCKSTINVCECNLRPMDGMDGCKKLQVKIAFDPFGSITSWELTQQLGVCWKSSCYFLVETLLQLKFVKFFLFVFFRGDIFQVNFAKFFFGCFFLLRIFRSEICEVVYSFGLEKMFILKQ